jgi:hypothetical protein
MRENTLTVAGTIWRLAKYMDSSNLLFVLVMLVAALVVVALAWRERGRWF